MTNLMSDAVRVPREPFMPTVTLSPDAAVTIAGGEVVTWKECLRRLAASPSVGGWEDISTAPKDSTEVLVLVGRKVIRLGWYFKASSRTEGWCDENGKRIHPTHWMPLPPPPVFTGSRPKEAVLPQTEKGS